MGTTGIKKSAVDIFFAIMKVPCLPALVPGDSAHADALLVAKRKLMSFGKHALRERSPECEEPFNLLPVYDPSDWRVRQKPRSMHSDTANVAFKVLWQRSFFTPVPSRFRGVWENCVQLLLLSAWHDVIEQVRWVPCSLFSLLSLIRAISRGPYNLTSW